MGQFGAKYIKWKSIADTTTRSKLKRNSMSRVQMEGKKSYIINH